MDTCGSVTLTDRRKIELTGIRSVASFDEYEVCLAVDCGKLTVEGEGLSISVLDLDRGVVVAEGLITAVIYSDSKIEPRKGLISRLFSAKE